MATPKTIRKNAASKWPSRRRPATKPTKKPRRSVTKKGAQPPSRSGTKQAALIALLERPAGATIAQMCAKTNWQSHSVRAALTGLRRRGVQLTRTKDESGTTVYRAGPA